MKSTSMRLTSDCNIRIVIATIRESKVASCKHKLNDNIDHESHYTESSVLASQRDFITQTGHFATELQWIHA